MSPTWRPRLFGAEVTPDRVIGETLVRATTSGRPRSTSSEQPSPQRPPAPPSRLRRTGRRPARRLDRDDLRAGRRGRNGTADPAQPTTIEPAAAAELARAHRGRPARLRAGDPEHAAGRIRATDVGNRASAVRLPAAPVPVQGRHRLRHPRNRRTAATSPAPTSCACPGSPRRRCCRSVLPRVRAGVPGGREGRTATASTVVRPRQDSDASGGDSGRPATSTSPTDLPWPATRSPRVASPTSGCDRARRNADRAAQPRRSTCRRSLGSAPTAPRPHRGDGTATLVRVDAVRLLPALPGVLRAGPRQRLRQARHPRPGGPVLGGHHRQLEHRSIARAAQPSRAEPGGAQAATFVDNRQDASLQAGHFNDFVQVTQLRGALYRAMRGEPAGLTHEAVAQRVTDALALDHAGLRREPDGASSRRRTQAERPCATWSSTASTPTCSAAGGSPCRTSSRPACCRSTTSTSPRSPPTTSRWATSGTRSARRGAGAARGAGCGSCWTSCAGSWPSTSTASRDGFERTPSASPASTSSSPGRLPDGDESPRSAPPIPAPVGRAGPARDLFISGRSAFGRYLRRDGDGLGNDLTTDDAQHVIVDLFARARNEAGLVDRAFRTSTMACRATGSRRPRSLGRRRRHQGRRRPAAQIAATASAVARVNPFFRDLYRDVASTLAGLQAKEHTAQVPPDRSARSASRSSARASCRCCTARRRWSWASTSPASTPSACATCRRRRPTTPSAPAGPAAPASRRWWSPTAPPATPRPVLLPALRSEMVAGSVAAPRLDLANEDLVRSHVHAIWLAETGQSLKSRITDLRRRRRRHARLSTVIPEIWRALTEPDVGTRWRPRARSAVLDRTSRTRGREGDHVSWWYDGWVERRGRAERRRASTRPRPVARRCTGPRWPSTTSRTSSPSTPTPRQRTARVASTAQARRENQLKLLRNEDSENGQTDFYSYRYLASEGFLPGYSFPRLPLAAYIPGGRTTSGRRDGDYLQRPRFLAIREFGPGALIYHEGARYEVIRVQLPPRQRRGRHARPRRRAAATLRLPPPSRASAPTSATLCGAARRQDATACSACRPSSPGAANGSPATRRSAAAPASSWRSPTASTTTATGRPDRRDRRRQRRHAALDAAPTATPPPSGSPTSAAAAARTERPRLLARPADGRWLSDEGRRPTRRWTPTSWTPPRTCAKKRKVIPYVEDRRNILVLRLAEPRRRDHRDHACGTRWNAASRRRSSSRTPSWPASCCPTSTTAAGSCSPSPPRAAPACCAASSPSRDALRAGRPARPWRSATSTRTPATTAGMPPERRERCEHACYDCLLSYGNQLDHAADRPARCQATCC